MKKILLIIDTPVRDLYGIALISYELIKKYGHLPIITTTKNEIAALIKYKPDLIVMPHVRYERNLSVLEFAKKQNTKVGILPVEGYPPGEHWVKRTVIGLEAFYKYIDVLWVWGSYVKNICEKNNTLPEKEINITGCPRFDLLSEKYDPIFRSKDAFCSDYQLNPKTPIVIWFSSSSYANPKGNFDEWVENFYKSGAGKIVKGIFDVAVMGRVHQRAHDHILELFIRLVKEYPECNFLVKPHPGEPKKPYHDALKDYANVRIINGNDQTIELIRHSDIQLNWRCTTSVERWMNDIESRIISIEPPNHELTDFNGYSSGNDVVKTFEELKERMIYYFEGGTVASDLIENRKKFIRNYFRSNDGNSTEKFCETIDTYLMRQGTPKRTIKNYMIIFSFLLRRIKRRGWIEMKRNHSHSKYFSPDDFHEFVEKLNKLFGTNISMKQYFLDV